jgi:hypothetical protein
VTVQQHPHAELSAYIDDALDSAASAVVAGHLVACAVCRAHAAQLRATALLIRAIPDPVPSRRLVPRLTVPAWLAPMRTLMTLASGTAVFLFIASALVSNITFLAGAPAAMGTASREASGDAALNVQAPTAAQGGASAAPAPAATPPAGFAATATASVEAKRSVGADATPTDGKVLTDQSARTSSAPGVAVAPQDVGRPESSLSQPSPLVNPWLWLALAILSGAIAIALHRRLRASVR